MPAEWVRGSNPAALGLLFLRLAAHVYTVSKKMTPVFGSGSTPLTLGVGR